VRPCRLALPAGVRRQACENARRDYAAGPFGPPPALTVARHALGSWLAFAFSLLCVLVTVVLLIVSELIAGGQVRSSIGANLGEQANQTTSRLDRAMAERYREVALMAQRLSRIRQADEIRYELDAMQQTYPNYAWIALADASGRVLAGTGGVLRGRDVAQAPWFRNALKGLQVAEAEGAHLAGRAQSGDEQRIVDIAFPVHRGDSPQPGVLGVSLNWTWAGDIEKATFAAAGREQAVEPLIVSRSGRVLLGPRELLGHELHLPSLEAAARGARGYVAERWPDGRDYLVGYSQDRGAMGYPGLGWRVLVRQELEEAEEPVRRLQAHLAGWGLAVAALFSLAGWFAARIITRPLKRLAGAARELESGAAVTPRGSGPYREVEQLGSALESLVRNLRQKEADLLELNASLERRVDERTAALRETFGHARENEERIQTILASAPDPFVAADFNGRITDWNPRAETMLGWRREEVLGRPFTQVLIPERYRSSVEQALRYFQLTSEMPFSGRTLERMVVDRAGREIEVELRIGIIDTGKLQLLCAFMHDISHRKEVQRLKSEFVSTVSHELRTPLTSIYGSLRLLAGGVSGALQAQGQQLLEMSIRSCERLIRLINDLLDLEKIESGQFELKRERVSLRDLLERALRDTQAYADGLGVRLLLDAPHDAQAMADPDRIIQVVVNLLSNAAKFSPRGDEVRLALEVKPGGACIAVEDHGPGIPPTFRARVFERFAQADSSDRREKGGTGLGLNICRSIVKAHGGTIGFESEPGVRTKFFFELPLMLPSRDTGM
jgi:PAS domain S-box-containing protein